MLPMLSRVDREELGQAAELAWEKIAESIRITESIVNELENRIVSGYERKEHV